MSTPLKDSYNEILSRIERACNKCGRNPDDIVLVAVSKTKPDSDVLELVNLGQIHFGENRAQSLEDRLKKIHNDDLQWHFIGTLQTNKIKYMAHRVNWIQSVHNKKALKEIEKRAAAENRIIQTLIQVNISDEDQKSGCDPDELESILTYGQTLKFTKIRGLMGMATFTDDLEIVRPEFQKLKSLRDKYLHLATGNVRLEHLSMGMTNDLEVAIEEGSTMLRIGTAIFGERN